MLTDVVDGEDVGMVQRRGGAGFLLEAAQALGVPGEGCRQNLYGDVAPETRIARAIDLAHAPGAKSAQDFIRAETRTTSEHHRRSGL
jgi:hypothetical protein